MKPSISWLEYQRLELIIPEQPDTRGYQTSWKNWWWNLMQRWQNLFQPMTHSSELTVWCAQDKFGTMRWSAHDRVTGRSIDGVSEEQIRVWIEQRYR
jgi:hypothetical protein